MPSDIAIHVEEVWKRYGLPIRPYLRRQWDRVRGQANNGFAAYGPWALQDISFEVRRGESLGIVGKNGAGKSTLLKLLAGVSPVTHGQVEARGRLFPMIELGGGHAPRFDRQGEYQIAGRDHGLHRITDGYQDADH